MKASRKIILIVVVVLIIACTMLGFWPRKKDHAQHVVEKTPQVVIVKSKQVQSYYKAVGTVEPALQSNLEARITAKIMKVLVRPGEKVVTGQLLVVLDDRDVQAQVMQAEQSVASAQARLTQTKANYFRMQKLIKPGYVTPGDFDKSKSDFLQAQAGLLQSQKALREAQVALSFCKIRAPSDGVILEKFADAGDQASVAKVLLRFQGKDLLRLVTSIPEDLFSALHLGDKLQVEIDSSDQKIFGTVSEIVPAIDPSTRTFNVKVNIPAATSLKIYAGMFGQLWIPTGQKVVLVIPKSVIKHQGQLESVTVFNNGVSQSVMITTGLDFGADYMIVDSGLNAGDRVIAGGK
jgi:RND family efflux transporter MFP subunit